mgnify:CR=1 FL=1|jgi:hypothetical protein
MRPTIALLTLLSITLLTSCVIAVNTDDYQDRDAWHTRQSSNAEKIEHLEIGKSYLSTLDELGEPNFTESFLRGAATYQILFYRTRHVQHDGVTSKDETTPLVFIDNRLVGWGDSAIEHATL